MKNANSRFVRVLAIVLVVLMVVPAALVGCGSNKANNAAISEALAAAEAARKEAEEAKAAADAAAAEAAAKAAEEAAKLLEEANKKAEEALKAAEEAKKELEEAKKTTAAPATQAPITTAAPTQDMKIVSEYAYKVLSDRNLDFLKAYYMYAFGATEDDLKTDAAFTLFNKTAVPNPVYAEDDFEAMVKLYEATRVAILQANTVDYINHIVENFVATLADTSTYVEHVINAYNAIDFASKYDVIDVVYAYALLQKALLDFDEITDAELKADLMEQLNKYGEDEIDVVEAINNEYYRYTGLDSVDADKTVVEEDDILYENMYVASKDVIAAVQAVFSTADLDVADIVYATDIDDKLEAATEAYEKWNTKYFVKADDAELVNHYDAFRQAFVGEAYVLAGANDKAWEATVAAGERIEELLAAATEAEDLIKMIKSIANLDTDISNAEFKYKKYVAKVADAETALNAWKAKYNFKDELNGDENANVKAIIEAKDANLGIYDKYQDNALIIKYFDFLEKTASAVNVDAFIDASEETLSDIAYNFNFKKYGAAVASALEWYFGKLKADGVTYVGGFKNIKVADQKGFEKLPAAYDVDALITADNVSINTILDDLFDVDDVPTLFTKMQTSYKALEAKKKTADDINDDIEELVEMGATLKVLDDYIDIFSADYEKFMDADDEEKATVLTEACRIKTWADNTTIKVGDDNFNEMIDWEALGAINANIDKCMETVVADAAKVALEYITWKAATGEGAKYVEDEEQIEFTYGGTKYIFSDLKPVQIDIYSYNRMLNVIELEKTLEDLFDSDSDKVVDTLTNYKASIADDDNELEIALTSIVSYCSEMVAEFYDIAEKGHTVAYGPKTNYPIIDPQKYSTNDWRTTVAETKAVKDDPATAVDETAPKITAAEKLLAVAFYGRSGADYDTIKSAVQTVLGSFIKYSKVGYGTSKGTTVHGIEIYPTSFQGAIYSVDPLKYATKNADGKVTGLDSDAYKAALDSTIQSTYTKWFDEYLKDFDTQDKLTKLVNDIAKNHLNYGLWTVEGEFEIDDEVYTYTVNSTGRAYVFTIYDSSDEKVEAIPFKNETKEYKVEFTVSVVDGVLTLTPKLAADSPNALPADTTIYALIDVKAEELAHDVRDYAEAIGANYDKFTNKRFGSDSTLDKLTAAQLQSIFDAEAKNDFYVAFETLRARIYNKTSATNNTWGSLGNYIDSSITLDATVKSSIETISKLARDSVYAMTPEANTIADIEKEFNKYATRVKAVLADNGYTVVEEKAADGYMQITSITK